MKPAIARQVGMQPAIPFIDLAAQQARIRGRLDAALHRVLAHGQYIMGPEVAELEARLSAFCGAPHTVACASGTDALALALMALGVRRGDAVLIPSFHFRGHRRSRSPAGGGAGLCRRGPRQLQS